MSRISTHPGPPGTAVSTLAGARGRVRGQSAHTDQGQGNRDVARALQRPVSKNQRHVLCRQVFDRPSEGLDPV